MKKLSDSWKIMKVQPTGITFDFDFNSNIYYDKAKHGFKADTLGLYKGGSVRAIGKIIARITAVETENGVKTYDAEFGELTDERKEVIENAMAYGDSLGHHIRTMKHRYFFVEKFYETDFKKDSDGGLWGTKRFDLTKIFGTDDLPDTEELAEKLKSKTWKEYDKTML